ncbi:MAG: EscU/YscU/HrcU family type III secretion system export apparatus switch protein [Deltaproteobacteria bacterium]|nr:EscU/YscU/HrcU family type III secretion system export apparatus switch protein [Deltaproteobacteria bacterium]
MGDGGSGEKSEEPTPEKLRKLREDGNLPKSQDVIQAFMFIACFSIIALTMGYMGDTLSEFMLLSIKVSTAGHLDASTVVGLLIEAIKALMMTCAPVLAVAFFVALAGNYAQVGVLFTTKPLEPNFSKLNPISGLKGLVNMKKLVELLKTIVKFTVVAWMAYDSLKERARDVILTIRVPLYVGIKIIGQVIWDFSIKIGVFFTIVAAADLFYQRKKFIKDNMMSKYDIKQEYKQSEGDPQHKAERKQLHKEIINGGGHSNVKKADAVVVNPDHIAIALKYDKDGTSAPLVVAKGERVQAEKIKAIAKQVGVPIIRNVPLAQALNKMEVGDEIPEELYDAVAEVLNFVYALSEQQKAKHGGK